MSHVVSVRIHSSQFPEKVRNDFLQSLRLRQVNHKFHYDSIKQTQKWLALHQAYSPSRTDADCAATYDRSFQAASAKIAGAKIHLIGLGCGGGQKDTRLLKLLAEQGKELVYTPSDVSVAMALVAQQTASAVLPPGKILPFVCDLTAEDDVAEIFETGQSDAARLLTFFGMIPNFEPQTILRKLAALLRENDWLLLSANLAPGKNYAEGVQKILPLYDNELTRDWLKTFLLDLGVEDSDGELLFSIEDCPQNDLKRIVANFRFAKSRRIELPEETFEFHSGDTIRLFFSYRHTPDRLTRLLRENGVAVIDQWITGSEEEGVFLCRKSVV